MSSPPQRDVATTDELHLQSQGHVSEMPRIFSLFSTLALAFSITNTWIGYSATFVFPLLAGAGRAVFCCLILASVACTIVATGLAEFASAYPSSGGQYHFAFMVAPKRYRAAIAFTTGWLSSLAWLFTTASTVAFCSQTALTLATMYHPDYSWTQWQVWLVYALITVVSCALIVLLPGWVPNAEKVFLFSSLLGLVVAFITILAASPTKQPASVVFTDWDNATGWPDGVAFLLATGQAMYGFLGMDGATHIAEEVPNPGRTVPLVIMMIMAIGAFTAIPWTIAFMFCTNNLESVASSTLPIFEVFFQAIGSRDAATFFTVWVCFIYYGATISCFVTSGRLLWAFSRDNGLPYSRIFNKVHPTLHAPVNATLLSGAFILLFGLLYIGSTTAFNSIVGLAILSSYMTCTIPQTILLFRGRHILPKRYFDLGAIIGPFCNAFSTLYVALYTVLFCFPFFFTVAPDSMNYTSAVLVGALIFISALWWGGKRKTFVGPGIDPDDIGVIDGEVLGVVMSNVGCVKGE